MREEEHLVRCGWPSPDGKPSGRALLLCPWEPHRTVTLEIYDLDRKLAADLPDRLIDLLEIAAYIHCTDQSVSRGKLTLSKTGAAWRRRFCLGVQVREPELWNSLREELSDLLGFLTDDQYVFEFEHLCNPPPRSVYFPFSEGDQAQFRPDEVLLFSGGLDSLAGALSALRSRNGRVALISHLSAQKIITAQTQMAECLRTRHKGRMLHIPVRVRKTKAVPGNDDMQRSRSFLFAALGVTAAHAFGLDRFRFYENGVVSLNLPIAEHVLGARATRTTHPQVLHRFARLFSRVLERRIEIENPFIWKTKGEVVSTIAQHGAANLIAQAVSCAHVRDRSKNKPHCGTCSQCLSRRFAVLSAGLDGYDPAESYEIDLLTGERHGLDRLMAVLFVRFAQEIKGSSHMEFARRFPEIWRAVPYLGKPAAQAVGHVLDLHRRHAVELGRVLQQGIQDHASALFENSLPQSSLLMATVSGAQPCLAANAEGSNGIQNAESPVTVTATETWAEFDPDNRQVRIHGVGTPLDGAHYSLLAALMDDYEKAMRAETPVEEIPCTPVHILGKRLGIAPPAVRRRVLRLREKYAALKLLASVPVISDLVETSSKGGYRLHRQLKPLRPSSRSGGVTATSPTGHKPAA